jgi:hypothetical protein
MNGCRELERLLAAGRESDFATHRDSCASCAEIAREIERFADTAAGLRLPAPSGSLKLSLYAIPSRTVSCEGAAELLARTAEGDLAPSDATRLEGHLSRCGGCREAARVLDVARDLLPPEPAPWLSPRLVASRPRATRRSSARSWLFGPRAAIAIAYAAALAVMVLGLNPADLARKAGTARLEQTARSGVQIARGTLVDQFGALQERTFRTLEALKGRIGGYGRAALSNALALVMRTESAPHPPRPRHETGSGAWKPNPIEIWTWRADGTPGGAS